MYQWCVYQGASDSNKEFCAREWMIDNGKIQALDNFFEHDDVDKVRGWLGQQAAMRGSIPYRIPRAHDDDPVILEVWV